MGVMGDQASIVNGPSSDVNPRSGTQMLRFIDTDTSLTHSGTNGDLYYLIDLSSYASSIADGSASVTFSAWFNTGNYAPSPTSVDNSYFMFLMAWDGALSNFPNAIGTPSSALASADNYSPTSNLFTTDADVKTWEYLALTLNVPAGTTYLSARLGAHENKSTVAPYDPGDLLASYADDVSLDINLPNGFIPNPVIDPDPVPEAGSSFLMLSLALIGLTVSRRRFQPKAKSA